MIIIKEDKSFLSGLDLLAIEKNIAKLGVHSIRLDRHFTEKQLEENGKTAERMSREEWSAHCEEFRKQLAAKIEKVMDAVNDEFMVYQYKNKDIDYSKDNWDLFFWSNFGDMSYVTLDTNKKRSVEKQIEDTEKLIDLLKTMDEKGIQAIIQFTAIYDENLVNEIVKDTFNQLKDQWINYSGYTGKIKEMGINYKGKMQYGFFKKGARKKYYNMDEKTLLKMGLNL